MPMNPWAIVAIAALAFLAGWTANGWRLNLAVKSEQLTCQTDRADRLAQDREHTKQMLGEFGANIAALGHIAQANLEKERALNTAAQEGFDAVKSYVDQHGSCRVDDADAALLRDNERRRAAAVGAQASH